MQATIGHYWAHQLKPQKKQGNIRFDGSCFYSWGTVVGQIVYLEDKTPVYLLNTGHYSNSTNRHQYECFSSIPKDSHKFSVSCGNFIFGWSGYWKFGKLEQGELVVRYLEEQLKLITAFVDSRSVTTERELRLSWWGDANRLISLTKCITMSKLIKTDNLTLKKKGIETPALFRKMIKALSQYKQTCHNVQWLVDEVLGVGVYQKYVERTSGARKAAYTRKINHFLGFESTIWGGYIQFYPWDKVPSFEHHNSITGHVKGGLTSKQIEKFKKDGVYVQKLLEIKKANFKENIFNRELQDKGDRKYIAKGKLEFHLGFRWGRHYYSTRKRNSFNYNGTTIEHKSIDSERSLTHEEYLEYTNLSIIEQKQWVVSKRQEMLDGILENRARHELMMKEMKANRAEILRVQQERTIMLEKKREYIAQMEALGHVGVRQLWHENLREELPYGLPEEFYYGGNVLLRVTGEFIETSKGIRVAVSECERLWKIVQALHSRGVKYNASSEVVHSTSNDWMIQRYNNDIMIAGCHSVAYQEMKYIAKELGFIK